MKRISILLVSLLVSGFSIAQTIDFSSTVYDFGKIKEDDGVAYHEFEFVNNGDAPLIVQRVNTSCGCATPHWSRQPVAPGQKGTIKVGYNATGRPNAFSKTITVISNAKQQAVNLRIKGFVIPHVKTIDEIYIVPLGDLRFAKLYQSMGRMTLNQTFVDTLKFLNKGLVEVKVEVDKRNRQYVDFQTVPALVKPNEFGSIIITYNPDLRKDWGFVSDRFFMSVNGKLHTNKQLTISGSIEEDFSKLSEAQLANAPRVQFNTTEYNFGNAWPEGSVVEFDFEMQNVGKSDLLIRKVKPSCGCTTVNPSTNVLKPGEKSVIKAKFRTRGYSGRQNKSITVITNDPKRSTMLLRLTGTIEKDLSKLGAIELNRERVHFANAKRGQTYSDTVGYRNVGKVDVTLALEGLPCATFSLTPVTVKPGERGTIQITYNPDRRNAWGTVDDLYTLKVNGVRQNQKLMVSAQIRDDFSKLDKKQLRNAPRAEFNKKSLTFDPASANPKVEFSLTNKGKTPLNIRSVAGTGLKKSDLTLSVPKTTLAAGEHCTIGVAISPNARNMPTFSSTIEVVTNDPKEPIVMLTVAARQKKI